MTPLPKEISNAIDEWAEKHGLKDWYSLSLWRPNLYSAMGKFGQRNRKLLAKARGSSQELKLKLTEALERMEK